MKNNYFLERIIDYIEDHISETLTLELIADEFHISTVYLKKMFHSFFHMPISHYIRKRRLSLSTKELLEKDYRIIDIALQYGFSHIQTYINAFKKEFGVTPYQWKQNPSRTQYTEKISCEFILEMEKGMLVMPETNLLPKLLLNGVCHHLGFEESRQKAPIAALSFWKHDYPHIRHIVEEGVYYGVTLNYDAKKKESDYYCCALVSKNNEEYKKINIASNRYLKFIYVGQHSYTQLSAHTAQSMYQGIHDFFQNDISKKYCLDSINFYFERIDTNLCNDNFCVMEWYIPYQ